MDDLINTLNSVIYTLNQVEVKGKANLERVLACVQTLEELKDKMAAEVKCNASENK